MDRSERGSSRAPRAPTAPAAPAAGGAAIELSRVTVRRGGRAVLDDVSLRIEPGELLVLIGPSGSGKTTLLSTLNRLVEVDAGVVRMDGKDVRDMPLALLRRRVGYCFQGLGLFPHMTVGENIAMTPRLLGWQPARIAARVGELLEKVGLSRALGDRLPGELSGGQAQRVAVARALAAEPPLLLLDEPFGALDPDTRARLQDELGALQREMGVTTVLVSHDLAEALVLATRIAVIEGGRVAQIGDPREVVSRPSSAGVAAIVDAARRRARSLALLDDGAS